MNRLEDDLVRKGRFWEVKASERDTNAKKKEIQRYCIFQKYH